MSRRWGSGARFAVLALGTALAVSLWSVSRPIAPPLRSADPSEVASEERSPFEFPPAPSKAPPPPRYGRVWVARRDLPAGTRLSKDEVRSEPIRLSQAGDDTILNEPEPARWEVAREIREGQLVDRTCARLIDDKPSPDDTTVEFEVRTLPGMFSDPAAPRVKTELLPGLIYDILGAQSKQIAETRELLIEGAILVSVAESEAGTSPEETPVRATFRIPRRELSGLEKIRSGSFDDLRVMDRMRGGFISHYSGPYWLGQELRPQLEQFYHRHRERGGEVVYNLFGPGQRAFTLVVLDSQLFSQGFILPQDVVDLYVRAPVAPGVFRRSRLILRNVQVLAVGSNIAPPKDSPGQKARTITVAVTAQMLQVLWESTSTYPEPRAPYCRVCKAGIEFVGEPPSRTDSEEVFVWSARDDLPAGVTLTRKHVARLVIRKGSYASFFLPDAPKESPEGMVVAVPIEFGQILTRTHIRDPAAKPAVGERTLEVNVRGNPLVARTIVPGVTFDLYDLGDPARPETARLALEQTRLVLPPDIAPADFPPIDDSRVHRLMLAVPPGEHRAIDSNSDYWLAPRITGEPEHGASFRHHPIGELSLAIALRPEPWDVPPRELDRVDLYIRNASADPWRLIAPEVVLLHLESPEVDEPFRVGYSTREWPAAIAGDQGVPGMPERGTRRTARPSSRSLARASWRGCGSRSRWRTSCRAPCLAPNSGSCPAGCAALCRRSPHELASLGERGPVLAVGLSLAVSLWSVSRPIAPPGPRPVDSELALTSGHMPGHTPEQSPRPPPRYARVWVAPRYFPRHAALEGEPAIDADPSRQSSSS